MLFRSDRFKVLASDADELARVNARNRGGVGLCVDERHFTEVIARVELAYRRAFADELHSAAQQHVQRVGVATLLAQHLARDHVAHASHVHHAHHLRVAEFLEQGHPSQRVEGVVEFVACIGTVGVEVDLEGDRRDVVLAAAAIGELDEAARHFLDVGEGEELRDVLVEIGRAHV